MQKRGEKGCEDLRVISQNGEFDFPYEQIVVCRNKNIVYARLVADSNVRNVLGEYGIPERAERAMGMLHEAHNGSPLIMQNIDIEVENFEKVKSVFKDILLVRTDDNTSQIRQISNTSFQFPQDSEVQL